MMSLITENKERVERGRTAIEAYAITGDTIGEPVTDNITDLITDLLHLANEVGDKDGHAGRCLRVAMEHYEAERNEELDLPVSYEVKPCVDEAGEITTCEDTPERADFWTVYSWNGHGLATAICDCPNKVTAEEVMRGYEARNLPIDPETEAQLLANIDKAMAK